MRRDRLTAAAFCVSAIAFLLASSYDRMWGDTFLNLYAGRWIDEHGVPHEDPFTIAGAGRPWTNSQWLANVAYYRLWELAGYAGVTRTSMLAVWTAYAMLVVLLVRRGAHSMAVAGAPLLGFLVASQYVFPRAQNLALPLFVALLWLLLAYEHVRDRAPWYRPWLTVIAACGLLALWSNLHGSAPIGAALLVGYAAWCIVRRRDLVPWFIGLLGAPLAMLATPYGRKLFSSHLAVAGNEAVQGLTTEWASVMTPIGIVQLILPAGAFAMTIIVARRRRSHVDRFVLAAATILLAAAMVEVRYLVWFSVPLVLLAADAARDGTRLEGGLHTGSVIVMATVSIAAASATIVLLATHGSDAQQLERMPARTVEAARQLAAERGSDATYLGDLDSSAVLLWRYPEVAGRVMFDPRLEVFAAADLRAWDAFQRQRGDDPMRTARDVDVLLASSHWRPRLAQRLRSSPGEVVETSDGVAVLQPRP